MTLKFKILPFLFLFLYLFQPSLCFELRNHDTDTNTYLNYLHDHWFAGSRKRAIQGRDIAWNYCDIKQIDFFVATFGKGPLDPTVTECFAKDKNGTGQIKLWSQVANSTFYYNSCGGAMKTNFYKNTGWSLRGQQGVGIGKPIVY